MSSQEKLVLSTWAPKRFEYFISRNINVINMPENKRGKQKPEFSWTDRESRMRAINFLRTEIGEARLRELLGVGNPPFTARDVRHLGFTEENMAKLRMAGAIRE